MKLTIRNNKKEMDPLLLHEMQCVRAFFFIEYFIKVLQMFELITS